MPNGRPSLANWAGLEEAVIGKCYRDVDVEKLTLHGNNKVYGILVFHLVDVEIHPRPVAIVFVDILLDPVANLLDDLQGSIIRNLNVGRFPPM